jgi:hypothetical protein
MTQMVADVFKICAHLRHLRRRLLGALRTTANRGWHVPEVPPKGVVFCVGSPPRPSLEAPGVPPELACRAEGVANSRWLATIGENSVVAATASTRDFTKAVTAHGVCLLLCRSLRILPQMTQMSADFEYICDHLRYLWRRLLGAYRPKGVVFCIGVPPRPSLEAPGVPPQTYFLHML